MTGHPPVPRWVRIVDAVAVACLLLAVCVAVGSGSRFDLIGNRIAITRPVTPLIVAAILLFLRHWWFRRPSLFERTNYPLTLVVEPGPELMIQILYDSRRFDQETITRMLDHFSALIDDMVAYSAKNLAGFSVATEKEREQILDSFNADLEVSFSFFRLQKH